MYEHMIEIKLPLHRSNGDRNFNMCLMLLIFITLCDENSLRPFAHIVLLDIPDSCKYLYINTLISSLDICNAILGVAFDLLSVPTAAAAADESIPELRGL